MLLDCLIQTRASSDEIVGLSADRLKLRITAPPVDGRANQHLIKLASQWFGVSKSRVTIVRGEKGRRKTLAIQQPETLPDVAAIKK